jgi:outer membrane protein
MKNAPIVSASVLFISAAVFFGCNAPASKNTPASTAVSSASTAAPTGKIAYVNIDTLEANYELLKTKRDEFKARQEQMEGELERSYQQMQTDAEEVQKKAQANNLTQTEYEAAQKRLMQMRQSLETRKQSLSDQLMKEQEDFNKDLKTRLNAFIDEYNKTRHYDYILSYSETGSSILYANKQFDVTKDVVDGMNASAKNEAKGKMTK